MRHDPASAAVVVMLRGLKMYGMAQAVDDLIEQGAPSLQYGGSDPFPAAQGRGSRTRGSLDRLPYEGRPLPGLQGSGHLRFCVQRSERGHDPPAPSRRVYRWSPQRRS
jgi:hypothetical protein